MEKSSNLSTYGILMSITGLSILIYLWNVLGNRGLTADTNGTSGYTNNFELGLGIFGFLLLLTGIVVFIKSLRTYKS